MNRNRETPFKVKIKNRMSIKLTLVVLYSYRSIKKVLLSTSKLIRLKIRKSAENAN